MKTASSSRVKRAYVLHAAAMGVLGGLSCASQAATFIWQGPGGTTVAPTSGNWNDALNWSGGLPVSAATTELDFNGSGGVSFTATDDIAGDFQLNILKLGSTDAAVTEVINASAPANRLNFVNNGATVPTINQSAGGAFDLQLGILLSGTSAVTLGGSGTGLVSLSGVIAGAAPLTINGSRYAFTGTAPNTYTGATTISGGTVSVNAGAVAIGGSSLTVSGGVLNLNATGAQAVTAPLTVSGGTLNLLASNQIGDTTNVTVNSGTLALGDFTDTVGALTVGGGTISGNPAGGIIQPTSTTMTGGTISGRVAGSGGLTKNGTGTGTLTGPNTYSGATSVNNGTLLLNGGGHLDGTSAVNIGGSNTYGVLTLDNSATNDSGRINDGAPVTFTNTGGTLNYTGNAGSSSELVGALGQTGGIAVVNLTNQSGASAVITGSSLTHTRGAMDFRASGGTLGTGGSNPGVMFTSAPATTNGVIGGWATVGGANFAGYDPANGVVAFTAYTPLPASGLDGSTNYEATGDVTLTSSGTINTLKLNPSAAQTIDLGSNNLTVNGGGGILKVGTATTTVNGTGSLGAADELILHVYGGTLVANAPLSITGAAPRLTKPGAGKLLIPVSGTSPNWMANQLTFDGALELNTTDSQTLSGPVVGGGALIKSGPGTLQITNSTNNYGGTTTINGGVVEMLSTTGSPNLNLNSTGNGQLGNNTAGNVVINGATLKLTTVAGGAGGTVAGNITLGRGVTFGANGGTLDITNTIGGTLGGGAAVINGLTVNGGSGNLPITLTGPGLAVVKFNGGQGGVSTNNPANGDLQVGSNALRVASFTGAAANTPIRFEITHGALMEVAAPFNTIAAPVTFRGVLGGDASGSGVNTNVGRLQLSAGLTNVANFTNVYQFNGGLTFEDAIQVSLANAGRTIDGNVTVAGAAGGHPGNVTLGGRGTGTAVTTNHNNALIVGGFGAAGTNRTVTVQNGGTLNLDNRFRTDQTYMHGVQLNSNLLLDPGAKLRLKTSFVRTNEQTNVSFVEVLSRVTANGNSANDSVIDVTLPVRGPGDQPTNSGGQSWGTGTATASLIVNGSGLGGLRINGLPNEGRSYSTNNPTNEASLPLFVDGVSNVQKLIGGGAGASPDSTNRAILAPARLAALTGSGGFLSVAAPGETVPIAAGSEWAAGVPVGLRVVNGNLSGNDVTLNTGTWAHRLHVDAQAALLAPGLVVNSGTTSGNGTIVTGAGTPITFAGTSVVDPGNPAGEVGIIGNLTIQGDATLNAGSRLHIDMTTGEADFLTVKGAVALNDALLDVALNFPTDPPDGQAYGILANDGTEPIAGTFAGLPEGATFTVINAGNSHPVTFKITYAGDVDGGGNDVLVTAIVPEPTALGAIALAGAALLRRRRRK
jgi:autotransporter-associated beta strand protein